MNDEKEIALVIAANIQRYMDINHLTRRELAQKVGVSVASVGFWCSGAKIPRMDKVDRMCSIFDCERSDILLEFTPSFSPSPTLTLTPPEEELITDYRKLNDIGKEEAKKRVYELTMIEDYTQEGDAKKDGRASA